MYRILRHGDHTHFVYALELPKQTGEPQEEFNIEDQASYIFTELKLDKQEHPLEPLFEGSWQ